jgi:glucosamine-6-phosphate deaminase
MIFADMPPVKHLMEWIVGFSQSLWSSALSVLTTSVHGAATSGEEFDNLVSSASDAVSAPDAWRGLVVVATVISSVMVGAVAMFKRLNQKRGPPAGGTSYVKENQIHDQSVDHSVLADELASVLTGIKIFYPNLGQIGMLINDKDQVIKLLKHWIDIKARTISIKYGLLQEVAADFAAGRRVIVMYFGEQESPDAILLARQVHFLKNELDIAVVEVDKTVQRQGLGRSLVREFIETFGHRFDIAVQLNYQGRRIAGQLRWQSFFGSLGFKSRYTDYKHHFRPRNGHPAKTNRFISFIIFLTLIIFSPSTAQAADASVNDWNVPVIAGVVAAIVIGAVIMLMKRLNQKRGPPQAKVAAKPEVTVTLPQHFAADAAEKVGGRIVELQNQYDRNVNIVLATGNTMTRFLHLLADNPDIDRSRINIYHLDEYRGIERNHQQSFAFYLMRHFMFLNGIPRENVHFVADTVRHDPFLMEYIPFTTVRMPLLVKRYILNPIYSSFVLPFYLTRYMRVLKNNGGADIIMLGMGMNGHLAFNERLGFIKGFIVYRILDRFLPMRPVKLSKETIEANKKDYPGIVDVPFAVTMGMNAILNSGADLYFLVNGTRKAAVLKEVMEGPIADRTPASRLRGTPNVQYIFDTEAASLLHTANNKAIRNQTRFGGRLMLLILSIRAWLNQAPSNSFKDVSGVTGLRGLLRKKLATGSFPEVESNIDDARVKLDDNIGLKDVRIASLPSQWGFDAMVAVLGDQPMGSFKPWIGYGIIKAIVEGEDIDTIILATTGNRQRVHRQNAQRDHGPRHPRHHLYSSDDTGCQDRCHEAQRCFDHHGRCRRQSAAELRRSRCGRQSGDELNRVQEPVLFCGSRRSGSDHIVRGIGRSDPGCLSAADPDSRHDRDHHPGGSRRTRQRHRDRRQAS